MRHKKSMLQGSFAAGRANARHSLKRYVFNRQLCRDSD